MKKLYLIRHGQSEWNVLGKIQGQKNTKLTEKGIEEASLLGKRLKNENIDIIYTSNLDRAIKTSEIIASFISKKIIRTDSLNEINFGPWEGMKFRDIRVQFKEEYDTWFSNPDKLNLPGGENLYKLRKRLIEFTDEILSVNYNKIAIVSHSATLKVLILSMLGIENSFYKNITLNNVSLSIIECRDFNNVLTLLNDISHLKEL